MIQNLNFMQDRPILRFPAYNSAPLCNFHINQGICLETVAPGDVLLHDGRLLLGDSSMAKLQMHHRPNQNKVAHCDNRRLTLKKKKIPWSFAYVFCLVEVVPT
jgi:hypothetical protein